MMTKSGKGATVQLTSLLQNCAKSLWSRGAVLADIRPWGARDLAYRIRKQSENHYSAQYVSMDVYCSPPTLHQLEGQLRTSPHVLRYLTFKKSSLPAFDKEARNPFRPKRPEGAIDLEADATERAKWEYVRLPAAEPAPAVPPFPFRLPCRARAHPLAWPSALPHLIATQLCASPACVARYRNLVMQRVFEGRTKQELVAEALSRHRFQKAHAASAAAVAALEEASFDGAGGSRIRVADLRPTGELLEGDGGGEGSGGGSGSGGGA